MSEYSRFVSYMYIYENGLKTMNVGFVKVESRNGQCRISLSLKNIYTGLERCQVYMFLRFGQELRGIYIGDVEIKNHGGDWNFRTDTENIAGSGYTLGQMSGMIIWGGGEKFYGTRWDHGDLDIRRFVTQWTESEPAAEPELEPEAAVEPETGFESEVKLKLEPELEPESEPEPAAEPKIESEHEPELELVATAEPEPEFESEHEPEPGATATEIHAHLLSADTDERRRNFRKILEQCPGMYPFEDDTVDVCVRLEPHDIGRMPIDCWSFGSNSFLLHGYYSYRHLILARLKDEAEDGAYILGVPGTRHSREAFMAKMFGFREFKPISEGREGVSDFGYWYTTLA